MKSKKKEKTPEWRDINDFYRPRILRSILVVLRKEYFAQLIEQKARYALLEPVCRGMSICWQRAPGCLH